MYTSLCPSGIVLTYWEQNGELFVCSFEGGPAHSLINDLERLKQRYEILNSIILRDDDVSFLDEKEKESPYFSMFSEEKDRVWLKKAREVYPDLSWTSIFKKLYKKLLAEKEKEKEKCQK